MKPLYDILGKSHFALAIICDILSLRHPEGCAVRIVSNISEEDNDSRGFAFEAPGIDWSVINTKAYQPDPSIPKILGSIGKSRRAIVQHFLSEHGITSDQYHVMIHPSAIVPHTTSVGFGVHIGPGVIIAPHCTFNNFCVINRQVSVGHHTVLEDYSCLNPGVVLAGACHLEKDTIVGAGATIIDQIRVGRNSVIGAGSVVTKNIPDNVVAYGVPARVIKHLST